MRTIIIVFLLILNGQAFSQASETKPYSSPLSYKISLYKIDKRNKSIVLKIRILNTITQNVIIDKTAIRYRVAFEKKGKESSDGGLGPSEALTATGDPGPNFHSDFILLPPKGVYHGSETLYFDEAFFEEDRIYTLSLTYGFFREHQVKGLTVCKGNISSNKVSFKN